MTLRILTLTLILIISAACQVNEETVRASYYTVLCPTNYSLVSASFDLSTPSFCVSNDLMTLQSGYLRVRSNDQFALIVNRNDAEAWCQSLGSKYDLISMAEYQAAAREVELLDENWDDGIIGQTIFANGLTSVKLLSGDTIDGYGNNNRNSIPDASSSWTKEFFNYYATIGYVFDVKAGEFYSSALPLVSINAPYDDVGKWFAPKGNYSVNADILASGDAGLGMISLDSGWGYITRGAFAKAPFTADYQSFGASSPNIGFHCVYHHGN